ncbi:MAG: type II toxin-antitoxin system HicA family toxin [Thermoproteota archaeon]
MPFTAHLLKVRRHLGPFCTSVHIQPSPPDFWQLSLRNHSYHDVLKVLNRHGFRVIRQRGSHIILMHLDGRYVTVPRHDLVKEPTLKSILDQARISKQEFLDEL